MESKETPWNPELSISTEDSSRYVQCMEEIKNRLTAAWAIFGNKTHSTPFRATNVEFACLQIRKILELIALASLSANKEEYSKQHANFFKHWKAKAILEAVEKVNPDFYPIPIREPGDSDPNGKVREFKMRTEGFLPKDDFSTIYDICSQTLHASNPYGAKIDYAYLEREIPGWLEKIKALLNDHMVLLINKKESLMVIMRNKEDGKARGTIMKKIDAPLPKNIAEAKKTYEEYRALQGT
jgi:hypothetical protein